MYVIGVDVGSGSVRAALFDQNGKKYASKSVPILQFHDQANFVEQSSNDIWENTLDVITSVITSANIPKDQIRGIGFDATCSLVALDSIGNPVSLSQTLNDQQNIIMWMDHRAHEQTARINATKHDVLKYIGGEVSIEMEIPKILWVKENLNKQYKKVSRFFDLADFLVWKCTGEDSASVCTLTCKWNYLAHEQSFSEDYLTQIGLDDVLDKFPKKVLSLGTATGTLLPEIAQKLGLSDKTIIATGIIDAHAGGLAMSALQAEGSLAIIAGTSTCHMATTLKPSFVPGVWGPYYESMLPKRWLNEGGQSAAGALLDWTIEQHSQYHELKQQADNSQRSIYACLNDAVYQLELEEDAPTQNLHVLSDHHGNRSPRANPNATGMVMGLTLEKGIKQLARLYLATLQALSYSTRHIMDTMNANGYAIDTLFMCGGGVHNPLWLREHANATACDIHLLDEIDVMPLGAALLAAVAAGIYPDLEDAAKNMVHFGKTIKHEPDTHEFHERKYQIYLKMYDAAQMMG
ncbi:ribulokinase [Gammaproteobacteria bacterium]|nr:ribulokinase [Gammaproteobacteria bacterium]